MRILAVAGLLAVSLFNSGAAIIGTNVHALPLTSERIAALPKPEQAAWLAYLQHSQQQRQADRMFLFQELKANHLTNATPARSGKSLAALATEKPLYWYRGAEARRVADNVISYQTPAGGWSKNMNMTDAPRPPGGSFGADDLSQFLAPDDNDLPRDARWSYIGTFDNNATITQLRFLARVASAMDEKDGAKYRAAFLRGLDYIFAAQYPNGGWPQVWPLEGGYHDAITYNDGAMLNVMQLLDDVAGRQADYHFVPEKYRAQAATALQHGIDCVLATQVVVGGKRTVWCQQHDVLTLQPTSARNYEMASLCSAESGGLVLFLMKLPSPGSNVVACVDAAAAWFQKTKLENIAFKKTGDDGRHLVSEPGHAPIWARYYEISDDRPIFANRDLTIHDNVDDITKERRDGYSWFNDTPKRVLQHYARWKKSLAP